MSVIAPGTEISYRVTWLEMDERPSGPWPPVPAKIPCTLLRAEAPPLWYFMSLYDAVGRDYSWEDLHRAPEAELRGLLGHTDVGLWTLTAHGWPHGFFLLDWRLPGICDIAYFGLVPEAVGQGLGTFLLGTAIRTGWERPGVEKLTVNTCSLDHPRALATYQKHGFRPVRQEERKRILMRPRDPRRIPD